MNWARRLRWQVAAPVLAALAAMTAAALQAPVLPLGGDTPSVAGNPTVPLVFGYTGSDSHLYSAPLTSSVTATESFGGHLVGGPGTTFVPAGAGPAFTAAFARGAVSNALYVFDGFTSTGSPIWTSLGGTLTSRPGAGAGALSVSGGQAIDAVVRGPDGAVWDKETEIVANTVKPWRSLGGRTLAGSGPAA